MRSLFYAVAVALSILLVACGGGGGGSAKTGLEIPVVSVSGIAFDGLISGGSVNIYDFTAGTKGTLLATATTNTLGLYSTSIQIESRPL